MRTPVGMNVPFFGPSLSALAEITAPILIAVEIASASADKRTRGRRVRPFPNICYLLFALQISGLKSSGS